MKKKTFKQLRSGDRFILDIWYDFKIIQCLVEIRYRYPNYSIYKQTPRKRLLKVYPLSETYRQHSFFLTSNDFGAITLYEDINCDPKEWDLGNTLDIVENDQEAFMEIL